MPSSTSTANPLPDDAEHAPAVRMMDAGDVNPLLGATPSKPAAPSGSNDSLIPAVGYVFGLLALIALLGQNTRAKFHGAQALVYGLIIVLLYMPVLIVSGMLGFAGGPIGGLIGMLILAVYVGVLIVVVPIYMAVKTYQGHDVLLPIIGKMVAEKIGFRA